MAHDRRRRGRTTVRLTVTIPADLRREIDRHLTGVNVSAEVTACLRRLVEERKAGKG